MVPESMESLLADKLVEVITDWCINHVPIDDDSRADHVILGKPTDERRDEIVISIHMQHPLGPGQDQTFLAEGTPRNLMERPYHWPSETWGGMRTEAIIGAVQVNYREKLTQSEGLRIVSAVNTRIKQAINQDIRLKSLTDDMGNFMSSIQTFRGQGYSSGAKDITIDLRWVSFRAWVHTTNQRITLSA